jgi:NitT/TauT family transport system substrate-binding protein
VQMKKILFLPILLVAVLALACGGHDDDAAGQTTDPNATPGPSANPGEEEVTLRLGYFANITHSQPLVGLNNGTFAEELGPNVTIEEQTFNAGPAVIEALFAGEIDASYIGPNPAINGFVQSEGDALRIVSGATSGGALFIVDPEAGITEPGDLDGKKLSTPQLGNTQDVALRTYLADNGLEAQEAGGSVQILPQANADTLAQFQQGNIDGAWVPEPWATRLIQEAGGEVFVDEKELWPDGKFVTTHLIVSTDFLDEHPGVVEDLVRANVKTTQWITDNPEDAKTIVNEQILEITTAALPQKVIDAAWDNIEVTYDPVASSLFESADAAYVLGFLEGEPVLDEIYDLSFLQAVLVEEGLDPVDEP